MREGRKNNGRGVFIGGNRAGKIGWRSCAGPSFRCVRGRLGEPSLPFSWGSRADPRHAVGSGARCGMEVFNTEDGCGGGSDPAVHAAGAGAPSDHCSPARKRREGLRRRVARDRLALYEETGPAARRSVRPTQIQRPPGSSLGNRHRVVGRGVPAEPRLTRRVRPTYSSKAKACWCHASHLRT